MYNFVNLFAKLGFKDCYFDSIAFTSGFKKRNRSLTCLDYISALIANASCVLVSYNVLACYLADDGGKSVSKQALQKAMAKDEFVSCVDTVYRDVFMSKLNLNCDLVKNRFRRIIIQDSTIIKLPSKLFAAFSGVRNGIAQVANARIQLAIDILTSNFIHFDLTSYSANDIKVAAQLPIKEGDLVLRDRGYFSITEIIRMIKAKASFIYRYKHGIHYCDSETGIPIDLAKRLSKTKVTTLNVKLGTKNGPSVRLVAMPVKGELADIRRSKLKKEAKHFPKEEVLTLLSWSIFITSIEDESISFTELFELYKLRWRIEIIFKSMKSYLALDSIHAVSEHQLKFTILGKLIFLILIIQFVYEVLIHRIKIEYGKVLSLLKLVRYLTERKKIISNIIVGAKKHPNKLHETLIQIAKYCTYDKRRRNNYHDQIRQYCLS